MNALTNSLPLTFRNSFVAYLFAVTTAAFIFALTFLGYTTLQDGFENATTNDIATKFAHFVSASFFLFLMGWLFAFITASIPFFTAIVTARSFNISHWSFFVIGGFLTAAILCIFHASMAQDGPPLGPFPDQTPSLIECYLRYCVYYMLSGSIAGVVCWLYLLQKQTRAQ